LIIDQIERAVKEPQMTGPEPVAAFRTMVVIREFENLAAQLRHRGTIICSLHLANGQEAIAVGAHAALGPADTVNATYRGHHWAIACGIPLEALFAEFMGRATGVNGGRGGAGFFADPDHRFLGENGIVGAGAAIGAGAALASRYDGSGRVALTAFGDGALNQGAVHEAMTFASIFRLPVVFVCENNGYAEYTPTASMFPAGPLEERARMYGFPGVAVDGTDPRAVRDAVGGAVDRARSGEGATLVVATARRLAGHHTHDAERYRPEGEKARWAGEADPIPKLRAAILAERLAGDETLAEVEATARADVRAAADAAAAAPPSDPARLEQHVHG
jgi:pyruvate dehydrogenase E1 component alpha subunit